MHWNGFKNRLKNRISHILAGTYNHSIELKLEVVNSLSTQRSRITTPQISEGKIEIETPTNQGVEPPASNRKNDAAEGVWKRESETGPT